MTDLNKLLPDFEDIMSLIEEVKSLQLKKTLLELDIKMRVADIYLITASNLDYRINGKSPSATFVKSTWEQKGIDGELIPLRQESVRYMVELRYLENKLSTMKDMIDVWRTLSANERTVAI